MSVDFRKRDDCLNQCSRRARFIVFFFISSLELPVSGFETQGTLSSCGGRHTLGQHQIPMEVLLGRRAAQWLCTSSVLPGVWCRRLTSGFAAPCSSSTPRGERQASPLYSCPSLAWTSSSRRPISTPALAAASKGGVTRSRDLWSSTYRLQRASSRLSQASQSSRQHQQSRRDYSSGPGKGTGNPNTAVKFWPFVLIIIVGTGAYVQLVNSRKGEWSRMSTRKPYGARVALTCLGVTAEGRRSTA